MTKTKRRLSVGKALWRWRHSHVTGQAYRPELSHDNLHPTIVPACSVKRCYKRRGHDRGIHGRGR